jgi:hypothetical protein
MAREMPSHKRYMEKYSYEHHRARLMSSQVLAAHAGSGRVDWVKFYTDLYTRLNLLGYLPVVLSEIAKAS